MSALPPPIGTSIFEQAYDDLKWSGNFSRGVELGRETMVSKWSEDFSRRVELNCLMFVMLFLSGGFPPRNIQI